MFLCVTREICKRYDRFQLSLQQVENREKDKIIESIRRESVIYKSHIDFLTKELEATRKKLEAKQA